LIFVAEFVRHNAEQRKCFMTFTKYCSFLFYNYFLAQDIEFQFSALLLLDIARQKVLSKSSHKLKIEILLVELKRRSECGLQEPLRQTTFGSALWRIIIHFSFACGIISTSYQSGYGGTVSRKTIKKATQTVLTITKALTKTTNCTLGAKKVEWQDQNILGASRRTCAPPSTAPLSNLFWRH